MVEIKDREVFDQKIKALRASGKECLHLVADFDRTLTKGFVNDIKSSSSWGAFVNSFVGYEAERAALFNLYHPIEVDPLIDPELRKEKMSEWYSLHLALLVRYGVSEEIIADVVGQGKIHLREGFSDFLSLISSNNIPHLVFSAGLGDVIKTYFDIYDLWNPHLHLISNFFIFDESGRATGFKDEIIHSFNKTEALIEGKPYFAAVKERRNAILLGDTLGDIHMADGLRHDTILRIGFLNEDTACLDAFRNAYDMVIVPDTGLQDVIDVLKRVL
jgi:5'-nucleotidase